MTQDTHWQLIEKVLSGRATRREKKALQTWLEADEKHAQLFEELQQAWKHSPDRFNPFAAYKKLEKRLFSDPQAISTSKRGFRWVGKIAASVLLLLSAVWLLYPYQEKPLENSDPLVYEEVAVPKGKREKIELADGTIVHLNADSRLRYPTAFEKKSREIFLEGEGYFEVVRNKDKPFLVHTQTVTTQVLGTRFNVKSYAGDAAVAVTVVSGKVNVTDDKASQNVTLTPNQQALYSSKEKTLTKKDIPDAEEYAAWTEGILVFNNTPLQEVIQELGRKYEVTIQVADARLYNCRVFGKFKDASIETTIKLICNLLDASYTIHEDEITIDGSGCE